LVKILLANGADKNAKTSKETREWLPIHYAAKNGNIEIVEEFLNVGVDKEVKTTFGLNILHIAVEHNHESLVKFLLAKGVDRKAKTIEDNHQMTCLHYAAINGNEAIASALLEAGVDGNARMTTGFSALEIAAKNNHLDVVSLLLQYGCVSSIEALKIAKEFKATDVVKKIELYEKAKKIFFKNLKYESSKLIEVIKEFDAENLSEAKNILEEEKEFLLNAHGILGLKTPIGMFRKSEMSLEEIAQKEGLVELTKRLVDLKALTLR
jgi:ankyrin repeat protein